MSINNNNPKYPPLSAFQNLEKKGYVKLRDDGLGVKVAGNPLNKPSAKKNREVREAFYAALQQDTTGASSFKERLTSDRVINKPLSTRKVRVILQESAAMNEPLITFVPGTAGLGGGWTDDNDPYDNNNAGIPVNNGPGNNNSNTNNNAGLTGDREKVSNNNSGTAGGGTATIGGKAGVRRTFAPLSDADVLRGLMPVLPQIELGAFQELNGTGAIKLKDPELRNDALEIVRPDKHGRYKVSEKDNGQIRMAFFNALSQKYPNAADQFLEQLMEKATMPLTIEDVQEIIAGMEFMVLGENDLEVNSEDVKPTAAKLKAPATEDVKLEASPTENAALRAFATFVPDFDKLSEEEVKQLDALSTVLTGKVDKGDLPKDKLEEVAHLAFTLGRDDEDWRANLGERIETAIYHFTGPQGTSGQDFSSSEV